VLVAGVCVAAPALMPALSAAAGDTFYVSPTADPGSTCQPEDPCKIPEALSKAGDGDSVSLAAGEYTLPLGGITIEQDIDFGGQPGAPATLETGKSGKVHVPDIADPKLHDLVLEGESGLELGSGTAERIYVSFVGALGGNACQLDKGTTLKDSVCWTQEVNEEEEGVSHALSIESGGENQDEPVVLRNVTAIASNAAGDGIFASGASGAKLNIDAANVIAHSANATDIFAESGEGLAETHVNISHSSFTTVVDHPSTSTVTPPGANGNLAAVPSFVDPAAGDFHLAAGSPGIDGGIADGLVGALDLDGAPRAQPGCFGGAAIPDMGAYERSATEACPPPPPPPPPPFEPRKPVFRIIKLNLNKRAGGGSLQVEVPSGGTLSLTGSGIKLVRRRAASPGDLITLPIQPWAITRVRLKNTGKSRVRLVLFFQPPGGAPEQLAMAVLLRKNRR